MYPIKHLLNGFTYIGFYQFLANILGNYLFLIAIVGNFLKMINMSSFWERVDSELEYRGLNRKSLAQEVGFNLGNIGKGIQLGSSPSADTAVKIAKVLGVSVEYLVTGHDSQFSKEHIDFKKYREYESVINTLDSLPESHKNIVLSVLNQLAAI